MKIFEKEVHKQLIEYFEAHAFITHTNRHIWRNILLPRAYIALLMICAKNVDDGHLCGACFDSINHKYCHKSWSIVVLTQFRSSGFKTTDMVDMCTRQ